MLRFFFAETRTLSCPKNALKNSHEKPVVNAFFGKLLRVNGDHDVTETHLKSRSWSCNWKKTANCQRLRCVCSVTADFVNKKSVIFGILAKGGQHENFLESSNFRNGWKWHILCQIRCYSRCCNRKLAATFLCLDMGSCPKHPLKKAPEKPVFNALFGKPLRAHGDCDVTETHLKWRPWSSSWRKTENC